MKNRIQITESKSQVLDIAMFCFGNLQLSQCYIIIKVLENLEKMYLR